MCIYRLDGVSNFVLIVGWDAVHSLLSDIHLTVQFFGQFFQGLSLGFWDTEGGQHTEQHEKSKDLHDVVQPTSLLQALGNTATVLQGTNTGLCNDGTDFTGSGRQTVSSGSVSGWVTLTWDNEGGGVWTKVLE